MIAINVMILFLLLPNAGNNIKAIKYPPMIPPKCPYPSISFPNENRTAKNSRIPVVQQI